MSMILRVMAGSSVIILIILALNTSAIACECSESPTVEREFAAVKHVAVLKAVSYSKNVKPDLVPEATVSGFTFRVEKVFKGALLKQGQQLDVFASGMCSFGFHAGDLGDEFLFYYFSDDMIGMVPLCSRSGNVEWRAADMLYLENMKSVHGLTRISGLLRQDFRAATQDESGRSVPLASITVRITGQGRDVRVRTDERGVYEVYDLTPGQYRIEPEKVNGYVPTDEIRTKTRTAVVTIHSASHAEKNFYFEIDNAIRGRVVDSEGKALSRVHLTLTPAHGKPAKYFIETDTTETNGSFEFKGIPAGKYVVVGNVDNVITAENPYPRFYSSGADDRSTAEEITIGPGMFLEGYTMRASKPAATVVISGRLLFEDGSPVSSGAVRFVTGTSKTRLPGDATAYPDKDGNFHLRVLRGQQGVIFGDLALNSWVFRSCPDQLKIVQEEAKEEKKDFPESSRSVIDSAVEMSGVELRFPFTLCREK